MLYRSVKYCFLISVSLFVASPAAQALTATSHNKGSTVGAVAYYATQLATATIDSGDTFGFGRVDARSYVENDPSHVEILYFDVYSGTAVTPTGDQVVGITVTATANTGSDQNDISVPIAYYSQDGSYPCQDSVNGCQGPHDFTIDGLTRHRFMAARYTPGTHVLIGLYPREICLAVAEQKPSALSDIGCSTDLSVVAANTVNPTTSGVRMSLRFNIELLPTSTSEHIIPTTTTSVPDNSVLALNFQTAAPTSTCTTSSNTVPDYFPGDGEIRVNTDQFQMTAPSVGAPKSVIAVAAVDNGPTPPGAPPSVASGIFSRLGVGGEQGIGPLTNSSVEGGNHFYGVSFLPRDAAGQLATLTVASCGRTDVQVAAIEGFLKKSRCFIATAAFGSMDAAPVEMLRDFRDSVLSRFEIGRDFIEWYYSWSPAAAEWLLDHPIARVPVLLLLAPIEILAWFALNPLIWLALSLFGATLGLSFLRPWAARGAGT